MNADVKISVCIATYNGASKLPATLEAIKSGDKLPDEVVVYIDGSTDNTLAVLDSYNAVLPLKSVSGSNSGRATARNKALAHATGDVVLFIDDDIIIPTTAVSQHLAFHRQHSRSILSCPTSTIPGRLDFSRFKVYLEHRWNRMAENSSDQSFSAAFFSIERNTMLLLGGFKDGLLDAEDYEFGLRARNAGITIAVNMQLVAAHNDTISCRTFILRNRQYAKANKHLVSAGIIQSSQYVLAKPAIIKKMLFNLLAVRFWVKLIDRNFFTWLYQPLRYKLYEYVAAAFIYYYPDKKL